MLEMIPSYFVQGKDQTLKSKLENDNEWAEVDKYRQLMFDKDLLEARLVKEKQIKEMKSYLDDQVKEKKVRIGQVKELKVRNDNMVLE